MPDYMPTGHHVFCGKKRIDYEMISPSAEPAVIPAPTLAELNIKEDDFSDAEFAASSKEFDTEAEDMGEIEGAEEIVSAENDAEQESPEDIAARLAEDRIKAQQVNLKVAAELAAELGVENDGTEKSLATAPAEETPEEIAARLAADRVHAQETNLEVAKSIAE